MSNEGGYHRSDAQSVMDHFMGEKAGFHSKLASYMRSDVLRELEIFQGSDHDFVTKVIEDVDCRFYKPGDTIIQEGEKADSCYILHRGSVSVVANGTEVAKLGDGSIFGEICLLGISQHRTASIVAESVCDVRVIHASKFQYALKSFPKEREHFRKEAQRRMREIQKTSKAADITDEKKDSEIAALEDEIAALVKTGRRNSLKTRVLPRLQLQVPAGRRRSEGNIESRDPTDRGGASNAMEPYMMVLRRRSIGSAVGAMVIGSTAATPQRHDQLWEPHARLLARRKTIE